MWLENGLKNDKMKNYFLGFVLCWGFSFISAQNNVLDIDFEFQVYPTGLIPGCKIEKGFAAKNAVHLRLGYQIIDHRDLGVQDDETGTGYGFTLGYKRYIKDGFKAWYLGIRNDIWFNQIDWKSNSASPDKNMGTTDIIVVQPTAELGYLWKLSEDWIISPSFAFGWEVNIQTEGEETGQGSILLFGLSIGRRF
jgi:hypothetical protein